MTPGKPRQAGQNLSGKLEWQAQNLPMTQRRKKSKVAMRRDVKSFRGIFKLKPGEKPFAEQMAEHKREENELEEAKFARCSKGKSTG